MQHRCCQTRQLTGFVQTQQRQQTGIFYFARVGAIHPGHIAPDSDARRPRQRTDLRCRVVRAVTAQQHGFARVAAADKARHDDAFARMLHQQLLQQRIREALVDLRLRRTLSAQEIARVQPGGLQPLLLQDCRHQARRPDFTVADHFSVNRFGHAAVQ
ncbi:hypothetical protein D3C72_1588950 [compost metagenome]